MVDVAARFPADRHRALAEEIRSIARTHPEVSERSARRLVRALEHGRLAIATDDSRVVGWLLSEGSGFAPHELGYLFVEPRLRTGEVFDRMLALLLEIESRAVAVTFRPAFAAWLERSYGFERASLGRVVMLSRGTFLFRRLTPARIVAVARHTTAASPVYLTWRRPAL
ncbi:hypothetical protein QCD70_13325 [Agreia sp. PsM10]|uniref:hypothetical protein n=1 Tax=Agreia sp. PsM10 TaxID=3030533 RepID=UPI00263B3C2D|nr:hypothetical protein [Agreia sp. PsM10]MDN4641234.1 hypothetical protein [Agreia sp. PsM10]